jgi:hypothetical protein
VPLGLASTTERTNRPFFTPQPLPPRASFVTNLDVPRPAIKTAGRKWTRMNANKEYERLLCASPQSRAPSPEPPQRRGDQPKSRQENPSHGQR